MRNKTAEGSRCGPFVYVRNAVGLDLAKLRSSGILDELRANDHESRGNSSHPAWYLRAASVLLPAIRGPISEHDWHRNAFQTAFEDEDARVRGAAWMALAFAWRQNDSDRGLISLAAQAMVDRFGVRSQPTAHTEAIAHEWMCSISEELDRPEHDQHALAARRRHLEGVGGRFGNIIAQLGPDEIVDCLSDENPHCRVTALTAIAGVIRSPEGDAKFIEGLMGARVGDAVREQVFERSKSLVPVRRDNDSLILELTSRLMQMATSDPDARVRSAAVYALGHLHSSSKNAPIERELARIAVNKRLPDHMRFMACHAIAVVHSVPMSEWPIEKARQDSADRFQEMQQFFKYESVPGANWEAYVNWELVRSCCDS